MHVMEHESLEQLQQLTRTQQRARERLRYQAVVLAREGKTAPQIADALGCARRPVQRWVERYNKGGVAALAEGRRSGRPPRLSTEQEAAFRQRLEQGPLAGDQTCALHGKDIRSILEKEFKVMLKLSGVYELLHRLNYSYLCPRPRHPQSDAAALEAFKKNAAGKVKAIQEAHPGKRVQAWFEDEARFGQQGTMTRLWAPTGSRPAVARQTQYEYLWVLTAVCPQTGSAEGLISPNLNTGVINVFLQQFSASLAPDVHAVLFWDGAGFHTANALAVPSNISIEKLPPRSPELMPVENLWHYLREHYWSNRQYADYSALETAAGEGWRATCLDPEKIKTICAVPYLTERAN
jgi:transposase